MTAFQYESPYDGPRRENLFDLRFQDLVSEANQTLPVHWHPSLEILYVQRGEILVHYNSERIRVSGGSLVVINPNAIHVVRRCNSESTLYWILGIVPQLLKEFRLNLDNVQFNRVVESAPITEIMREIIDETYAERVSCTPLIHSLIVRALVLLQRYHSVSLSDAVVKDGTAHATQLVIRYIHEHFPESFTLDSMCRSIGFSKFYISRLFKKEVGVSLVDYISEYRCFQAHHLLQTTDESIGNVARLCGFNSPSYFTRMYERHLGRLPSEESRNEPSVLPRDASAPMPEADYPIPQFIIPG